MKIVEVTYEDITQKENVRKEVLLASSPKILKLYGILLKSDASFKVIWNWDEDGTEHDALIIPQKNVISIKELRYYVKRKRRRKKKKKRRKK